MLRSEMEVGAFSPDDLTRHEVRVRSEIRQLQEERAAVMEDEILALRKEREVTIAQIATLQVQLQELRTENDLLKNQRSDSAILVRLAKAEQDLVREIESKNDMRGKLKVTTQHNGRLLIKVKRLENELNKRPRSQLKEQGLCLKSTSLGQLTVAVEEESVVARGNVVNAGSPVENGEEDELGTCCQSCQTDDVVYRMAECQTGSGSELISTESQTDMLAVQPTVQIRYKVPDNVRDALTEAHQTIDELRQQSAEYQSQLAGSQQEMKEQREEAMRILEEKESELLSERKARESTELAHGKVQRRVKHLEAECDVLRSGLEEFRSWSKRKLKALSEEMKICRVIYSLRNSLSQEQSILEEMAGKLAQQQKETATANEESQRLANQLQICQKQRDEASSRARMLTDQLHAALQAKDEARSLLLVNQII